MKIRSRFIIHYSALSVTLLLIFSVVVVFFYARHRKNDFKIRLENRTLSSVNMLFKETQIDSSMLRLIDKNIITAMSDYRLWVYQNHKLVYSNIDRQTTEPRNRLAQSNQNIFNGKQQVAFPIRNQEKTYNVVATAVDVQGMRELKSLMGILTWVLLSSLLLIAGFGFYNATWSLRPFQKIIKEVEAINPRVLKKRLTTTGTDEISQLSGVINMLLDQIAQVLETEKSFIANASHELRTPVTSILGQIEVVLNKSDRGENELREILESVQADTQQMANIINGFLDLAQANLDKSNIDMRQVAIDDLIFSIIDDFKLRKPTYSISVEFLDSLENDNQTICHGNERMLRLMLSNIIDNACKYTNEKSAKVKIRFVTNEIQINIIDYGIGIPQADLENIFKPLYRASNAKRVQGFGIGLAIVKRIADLHGATLSLSSEQNLGTKVTVIIPTI